VRPDLEYDHLADATVTSAAVRRPPERLAGLRRFAPGGDLLPLPAQRRAPAGCPPYMGCEPRSPEAGHLPPARRRTYAGRRPGGAARPEYDHLADATATSAAVRRPPERPARLRRFSPGGDLVPLPAQRRASAGGLPYMGCEPRSPEAGHLPPARGMSYAGSRPGGAVRPEYDHLADATVTSATVRWPPERPARRRRYAPGGDLVPSPAQRRAPAGCPPYMGCEPRSPEAGHP
jgi:hypothetical protein